MWHNADADSALNFPKWIIQNNFIFNKLTDDSPSPYKKLALKFHPQRCSDSWKSSSLPWCADAVSTLFRKKLRLMLTDDSPSPYKKCPFVHLQTFYENSSANYVICYHFTD